MNANRKEPIEIHRGDPPDDPRIDVARGSGAERSKLSIVSIVSLVFLASLVAGGLGARIESSLMEDHSQVVTPFSQQVLQTDSESVAPGSVADLYARIRPSVVKVTSTANSQGQSGTGSGLILDTQGRLVTNYHVISGFNHIDVRISDGTSLPAQVVGTDPGDDLAVISINPGDIKLTPTVLGDSDTARVGDTVIAVGNPLDLEATLTEGVISGEGRVLNAADGRPLRQLLQTDTAINPGNSGGGLFNLSGQLVGITNALENPSGAEAFAGIGYAIPVSTLKTYLPQMLAGQKISHARLGISVQDVTPAVASSLGLDVQQGILVGRIDQGSAAAKAGLVGSTSNQAGDVITAIDGHPVKAYADLADVLDSKSAGDKVALTVRRGGKSVTVDVTLDAWSATNYRKTRT